MKGGYGRPHVKVKVPLLSVNVTFHTMSLVYLHAEDLPAYSL